MPLEPKFRFKSIFAVSFRKSFGHDTILVAAHHLACSPKLLPSAGSKAVHLQIRRGGGQPQVFRNAKGKLMLYLVIIAMKRVNPSRQWLGQRVCNSVVRCWHAAIVRLPTPERHVPV